MTIREATPRDLPELIILFAKLLVYLESKGNRLYTNDQNTFTGGIMEYLIVKMNLPESVVLVMAGDENKPVGFIVGWIVHYPKFFQDSTLGEIQFMFPLLLSSRPLLAAFDAWAQERGATARSCYATPTHEKSWKIMELEGMDLGLFHFYKRYGQ